MKYRIQLFKNKRNKYQWRLVHKNGHKLATSESYSSKAKAKQTALNIFNSFKKNLCKKEF